MANNSSFGVRFVDPQTIIGQLDFGPGMAVADFGCGAGYFSLPIAQKIGKEGIVYSLDILPQKLESVESRAKNLGLANIVTKQVNLEKEGGSKLDSESMDWVILKDILFQNKDKGQILAEARRVLKTGGKALVVEWKPDDASLGPSSELRISEEALIKLAEHCNFGILKKIDAGNFHYALVLVK